MFLNCHSYHSLRYGTISVEELVRSAAQCGVTALALTDINTVTGIYEFYRSCNASGIKPLVGIEFRNGGSCQFIGLAKNADGVAEMNRFLTGHNFKKSEIPATPSGFENTFVVYPVTNIPDCLGDDEYVGIRPDQLYQLFRPELRKLISKMVMLHPVTLTSPEDIDLHRILRAIDGNKLLSMLRDEDCCGADEVLFSQTELEGRYCEYPQIVANTRRLVSECNYVFDFSEPKNKKYYMGSRESDIRLLTSLAMKGLDWRYGADSTEARARVEKELAVIDQLEFSGYFLITWDIVQYSTRRGFIHIGRGSGANSIIAYCLGITDICPLELDLYFERFLNVNRKSPPDFDIDWSWKERDEILTYIFTKYGRDHVAFTGTNVEFKYRSIMREVGKVFGLPKAEIDFLANNPMDIHDGNPVVKDIHRFGRMLEKFPNQRSMHSCGVLISEKPITCYSALEMPPKQFPIVQFDMHTVEEIGLEKFDILSQRGIGSIMDAVQLIRRNRNVDIDITDTKLTKNESECNQYLGRGQTIGCFYIESPAMRGLLRRLKCDNYKTLVAASSIIRPGVAQSGMMKEYIFRHNYPDRFEYFHPVFEEQLGETYGIMVYQEDVIKIALHYGGLPASDGDILRRAMSGKGRSKAQLDRIRGDFLRCCREKGHPDALSEEIYRQIESFAGYSFCKAHSASYAVESYWSLYLKVYFPIDFMTAVINNDGGFYRTEVYVHEARMSGAAIHNPCVNNSIFETTLYGDDIYLGFKHLKSLRNETAISIEGERESNGQFVSLEDFISRVPIGIESVQILIFIGAFRFTGIGKNELILKARQILNNYRRNPGAMLLFEEPQVEFEIPVLERSPLEDAYDEIELLSFATSFTPFDLLKTKYRGEVMAKELHKFHKQKIRMVAYLISRKHVPTKKGTMYFGTWVDVEGNYFDTAHFPDCLQESPFRGGGCYLFEGIVEVDYHFPTITVTRMGKLAFIPDPRYEQHRSQQFKVYDLINEDVSMTQRAPYPQEHEINLPRYRMADGELQDGVHPIPKNIRSFMEKLFINGNFATDGKGRILKNNG
ncbi:DNA polymerase III subunit alpha [Flavobacterium macacae]|uniref:DNA-directed DNA polymerase n=1 Tax=Flavobacterium macacae TaxID=2488993 RepID=A0A3P3W8G8_9FLAO|nr:DNA polymerase III subunit alpha [Flavobacterium macacae]RRJ90738.1 DNA polymerase III subunit alpha [Flavobacterium macacae]